jgi:hypothetical protein
MCHMGNAAARSASAIISSVEALAQYAALHGMNDAQDALMDILAAVHGWDTDMPRAADERHCGMGFGPDRPSALPFRQPSDRETPLIPGSPG